MYNSWTSIRYLAPNALRQWLHLWVWLSPAVYLLEKDFKISESLQWALKCARRTDSYWNGTNIDLRSQQCLSDPREGSRAIIRVASSFSVSSFSSPLHTWTHLCERGRKQTNSNAPPTRGRWPQRVVCVCALKCVCVVQVSEPGCR